MRGPIVALSSILAAWAPGAPWAAAPPAGPVSQGGGDGAARAAAPAAAGRLSRTYTQHLAAPPGEVLPLLGPVGEKRWGGADWNPAFVYPPGGADEAGCIFTTGGAGHETIWVLAEYDAAALKVRYLQVTPGVKVTDLSIALSPEGERGTAAAIRYTWTSLSPRGDAFLAAHAGARFDEAMAAWESAVNDYLKRTATH